MQWPVEPHQQRWSRGPDGRLRRWPVVAGVTGVLVLVLLLVAGSLTAMRPSGQDRLGSAYLDGSGLPGGNGAASTVPTPSTVPAPSASPVPSVSAGATGVRLGAAGCSAWSAGVGYAPGDVVTYRGKTYTALIPHTLVNGVSWSPDTATRLWRAGGNCAGPVQRHPSKFAPPPTTWQEHWFEHNQNVRLVAYNDTVALYFDDAVNTDAGKWMLPFLTHLWRYAQRTYGNSGNRMGERLYSISHQGRYLGGHPSTVYDSSHDFRNVIDVGAQSWDSPQYGVLTHETGHIVEFIAAGKHGSPAFALWQDSKWMEFYIYDAYVALGMTDAARSAFDTLIADSHVDDFPVANTHWFRDWFYPLWRDDGHAQVMVNFFGLLGQYFPANGADFARDLNRGEFIHFMSGAAGTDLRPLAAKAFGWPADWEAQYQQAKLTFPQIKY